MSTPYDDKILLVNYRGITTPGQSVDEFATLIRQKMPNVSGVMLKTSNGVSWQGSLQGDNDPKAITGVTRIGDWVNAFRAHGLEVHVWGVPRCKKPADLPSEVDKLVSAAQVPGVASLLLDVEHGELYWQGTPDNAREMMESLRAALPQTHIGLIIDGRRPVEFSWRVAPWAQACNSIHPMIYPLSFGLSDQWTIERYLDLIMNNLLTYNLPLVPMLQSYPDGLFQVRPTPEQITRQGAAAFARGAAGISFFRIGSDNWKFDNQPIMGDPEYGAIAAIPLPARGGDEPAISYTWQDVINATVIVGIRIGTEWQSILEVAGFLRLFNEGVRNEKYSGTAIDTWPLDAAARAQLLELLKMDSSALAVLTRQVQAQSERDATATDASNRLTNGSLVGIHGAPGAAAPPPHTWDTWIKYLKDMRIVWWKQVDWGDQDDDNIFNWVMRLKQEGIEPIIRYYMHGMFPNSLPDAAFDKMRRYAQNGVVWAEIGNEPNLNVEWREDWKPNFTVQNAEVVRSVAETWIKDARRALDSGAKPAYYATAPVDWRGGQNPFYSGVLLNWGVIQYLANNHRQATVDIFREGGWIATHSATFEQPVDFSPFANGTVPWEMTLRGYEIVLKLFKDGFGADLPVDNITVMSTEGGVYTMDSSSMDGHDRLHSPEEHAQRTVEMFRYLDRQGRLTAMCPWCIAVSGLVGHYDPQFANDGWIRDVNGQLTPLPVYNAMRQLSFDQQHEEAVADSALETIRLNVVYLSQNDPQTAKTHGTDCGPTCLAMISNTGKPANQFVTVDKLYATSAVLKNKQFGDITDFNEMAQVASELGITLVGQSLESTSALETLRGYVREGRLCIALVNYDKWMDIAQPGFDYRSAHFVVVTGFEADHIYVHDPIFPPLTGKGPYFVWSIDNFNAGWGTLHELNLGDPDYHLLVSDRVAERLP